MKIQSTPLTFIDQTDSRKLEVYLKSNLPNVQIYNTNTGAYTPDWRLGEKLILSSDVFLDSRVMTEAEYEQSQIKWYQDNISTSSEIVTNRNIRTFVVSNNVLSSTPIVTYICEATYQNIVASARITFARVDTGMNGEKGIDGTSIRILGNAKEVHPVIGTNYFTVVYTEGSVAAATLGDAYVSQDGNLYVCAVLNADNTTDYFVNVGPLQGPKGDDAKSIVLSASSQTFKVDKEGVISPSTITVVAQTSNTEVQTWEYSVDGGNTFHNAPAYVNRIDNIVTINGLIFNSNSLVIRASDGVFSDTLTVYKVFDGVQGDPASLAFLTNENVTFVADYKGKTYGTSLTTNIVAYTGGEKVMPVLGTMIASELPDGLSVRIDENATMYSNKEIVLSITVDPEKDLGSASSVNGTIAIPILSPVLTNLKLSWSKVNSGAPGVGIDSTTVFYGVSNSSEIIPGDDDWQLTIPVVADGEYLWTRTVIDYTDPLKESTVTYTYSKQGDKGDKGDKGSSVTVSSVLYQEGSSATVAPNGEWAKTVVEVEDGKYLWTKTTFSDKTIAYGVAKQGTPGRGIVSILENYLASSSSSGVTTSTSGWTSTIQTINASKRYLWNYETIVYTDNKTSTTTPVIIGVFGNTGDTGKGIKSITEYYLATSADSGITTATTGWKSEIQHLSATNKYLWNYELITYTDNSTETINPVIIGVYGDKGDTGTPASLVDVTQSSLYFKSTTGSNGPFEPQYIYLYPRFQNATYSNWQYSRDGGLTWVSAAGANGLSIGTYNSSANALRIERTSTLYTDSITSLSFRCNSTNSSVYDTVSVAKIYDVADLQIGGRNLILNSDTPVTTSEYLVRGYAMSEDWEIGTTYTVTLKGSINSGQRFGIWANGSQTRVTTLGYDAEKKLYISTFTPTAIVTQRVKELNVYNTPSDTTGEASIEWIKLEKGNTATDWSPAPEDLIEEAANVNVMLSNEAHFFEATAGGVPIDTSVTLDVVGYKGSVKSATTVGTIAGIPSAGMTATITNNNTTNTKLTIAVTSALTSDIADYGILTIPITVNGHTINKIFNWTKAKAGDVGASGSDAVTFQVYSNNGYSLSTSVPTITLQTFAYVGDVEIKAGATYQWYRHNNTDWAAVSGATNDYFNVSRDDVTFSNNYQCKMQFGGAEYIGVVTIEDKNDENKVFASKPSNYFAGDLWIVGTDYVPVSYTVGTMLRAEHTNTGYTESDWVPATKYDDEIKELKDTVDSYKQYFSVNSTNGLQIGNSSINNDILTTDTVNASTVNASSASLESLDIVGRYSGNTMLQAPVINLGNFSLVIESNGSLSIVANT